MDADVLVESVQAVETKSGNTRYVVRDADGREYSTFRPAIGKAAAGFEGKRAHIQFHEEERSTDPDEVAWNTAVEAAPWVLGSREPEREIPPEELYEKLEPFKRLVADDIREGPKDDD